MEKKNNKGLIFGLVFCIIILLGLAGYIVYDKVLNDETEKANKTSVKQNANNQQVETKNITKDSALAKRLYYKVKESSAYAKDLAQNSKEAKFYYALSKTIAEDMPCASVKTQSQSGYRCGVYETSAAGADISATKIVSKESLVQEYQNLFGATENLDLNTIYYDSNKISYYAYDSYLDSFVLFYKTDYEGGTYYQGKSSLEDASLENGNVIIVQAIDYSKNQLSDVTSQKLTYTFKYDNDLEDYIIDSVKVTEQ